MKMTEIFHSSGVRIAKNPVSFLQEYFMCKRGNLLPEYQMESIGTIEQPRFRCTVKTLELTAVGEARNKKDAKQIAAENALVKLGYKVTTNRPEEPDKTKPLEAPPNTYNPYINYIGELNEFASGKQYPYPEYNDLYENGQFKFICKFMNKQTEGFGQNKKEAKRLAAFKMMESLKDAKPSTYPTAPQLIHKPSKAPSIELDGVDKIIMDKFSELSLCVINKSYADSNGIDMKPHPELKKKNYSIEEAGKQLRSLGYTFSLKTMQNDPYIVAVQLVGKEFTLIAFGDTEAEATQKVLNDSIEVIREGCSGFVPDTNLPMTI